MMFPLRPLKQMQLVIQQMILKRQRKETLAYFLIKTGADRTTFTISLILTKDMYIISLTVMMMHLATE